MEARIQARADPVPKAEQAEAHRPPTPEKIFEDYAPRVYHLARRLLGNDADAEDVTQDVFVQVVRKLPTFRGEAEFSTWLYRVAVNAALAYRRKRALRQVAPLPEPLEDFAVAGNHRFPVRRWMSRPNHLALGREAHQLIEEAIAGLPEAYRDVYVLADVEELSNAEIADLLDLSVAAVKSRLHRARLLMRKALAPYFEEQAV
jgi:RNA polymerase sigma-70 factor (ECF subfamily)